MTPKRLLWSVTGGADRLFHSPQLVLMSSKVSNAHMDKASQLTINSAVSPSGGCWRSYWIAVVLLLVSAVTMSAPVPTTPKWVNPCGVNPDQVLGSSESEIEIPPMKPHELFNNIALQALLAKEHADAVIAEFVMDAFRDPHFPTYSTDLHYDWLPHPSRPSPQDLDTLQIEGALRQSYETLQHYAVGLEQLVMDQILHGGDFLDHFRQLEGKLRQVLCELQLAMIEMKIKQNPDVQRIIMAHQYRDLDSKTARDLRDWIVLRDYIGALDFVSTIFSHFKTKAATS
uniref:Uncharacterized protein n=1 Tax=Strigamia maritima TaxID=126957 RepID=T1IIR0_STRMM